MEWLHTAYIVVGIINALLMIVSRNDKDICGCVTNGILSIIMFQLYIAGM